MVPVLPESAPFSAAQRAWLNGFFAGVFGADGAPVPARAPEAAASSADSPPAIEEAMPWHDPSLSMDERLRLAEGQPLERRLMAAMAQLDCGACGYLCRTYGEAIASGAEKNLALCAPGGAATARKLKEILRSTSASSGAQGPAPGKPPAKAGHDRRNPFQARLLKAARLNSPESEKDTRHVVLDLEGSGIDYEPGDSLGVWPDNCPELVESILESLGFSGEEPVPTPSGEKKPIREALLREYTVTSVSDELRELVTGEAGSDSNPDAPFDLLDLVAARSARKLAPAQIVELLPPLAPRLYSISSSLKAHPDEVHLTVSVVRYTAGGRERKGVASTFLAERARAGQRVPVFVQKSHGFRLPGDPGTRIVMIGPGTGVAPFRAFLQERRAMGATGPSWLFFGDQRRSADFLYRQELEAFQRDGYLHRLDLAFSRDQEEKVYVQHRMRENAGELWRWIDAGATIYVCGDARRMARDVDLALQEILASQGGLDEDGAREMLEDLRRSQRYLRDVY